MIDAHPKFKVLHNLLQDPDKRIAGDIQFRCRVEALSLEAAEALLKETYPDLTFIISSEELEGTEEHWVIIFWFQPL